MGSTLSAGVKGVKKKSFSGPAGALYPAQMIIRDIDKGAGEVIRVEISEYKGQKYLNLRVWYTDKSSGELKPTQKGITVRPDLYDQIKGAVLDAEEEIRKILSGSDT